MVKPLNKEWALFGPKYRVPGAKGDKVDCHACQKQVSAAVNRLQSHLRVCPARPLHLAASTATQEPSNLTTSATAEGAADAVALDAAGVDVGVKRPRAASAATTYAAHVPRPRLTDDAYATRRLEIEEERLALERERAARDTKRATLELAILAAQARKERLAADKEAYEARVLLALSRKQLRDQGVDEHEIDRVLPTEPWGETPPTTAAEEDATEEDATEEDATEEDATAAHAETATAVTLDGAATTARMLDEAV